MNILVIGSGGREHAIIWKIKQNSKVDKIYCAPGNAGISTLAENVPIKVDDFQSLANFAKDKSIDLTVVGTEAPLAQGIVDFFEQNNLKIFGPNKKASELEGSKVFSKNLMQKYSIPTASYKFFTDFNEAKKYLECWPGDKQIVVKADGLAAGKGVIICDKKESALKSLDEIMVKKVFGSAGNEVVIEEYLQGQEASIQIFVDGKNYSIMSSAQDHKRVFENDQGPNTGGMGAYAPAPIVDEDLVKKIESKIIKPLLNGLSKEGIKYKGVLYIGLMIDSQEPYVLEFNCRFGDPETQVVLPLLKSDLVEIIDKIVDEKLDKIKIEWYNNKAVCVVLASKGYPGSYEKGKLITGLDEAENLKNIQVFHAGTSFLKGQGNSNQFVTSGGRVLGVTGLGKTLEESINITYEAVNKIKFDGMHYRKDIGKKAERIRVR